jgi:preprotein translocase subunit SecA
VPHQLLNAKNHEKEATIISEAGRKGAVTIATNIAGRGVDIILGGTPPPDPGFVLGKDKLTPKQYEKALAKWLKDHEEVVSFGGLYVIGTERHESRRIDNQLRGRSGRQGDPGATRFYLGLDDEIMRIFGGDAVSRVMTFLKIPDNEPIEHSMVSKAIEQAQVKVEGFNFDARKNVVEYDDVMNKQREIIYGLRNRILEDRLPDSEVISRLQSQVSSSINMHASGGIVDGETLPMVTSLVEAVPLDDASQSHLSEQFKKLAITSEITQLTDKIISDAITSRKAAAGDQVWKEIVRFAYLSAIDNLWVDHLDSMDDMRTGVGLRAHGQRDPLVEYKQEAFSMFEKLVAHIDSEFSRRLLRIHAADPRHPSHINQAIEIKPEFDLPSGETAPAAPKSSKSSDTMSTQFLSAVQSLQKTSAQSAHKTLGRNDPCWCGSGKKYKKCHYPN